MFYAKIILCGGIKSVKWVNHKLVTTAVVFAVTGNVLYAAYSYIGSVLPDRLEGRPPKESKAYWKWRSKHRQTTHWSLPYLAVIAVLMYLHEAGILSGWAWQAALVPLFIAVGALLHIAEDGICGKVPLIRRKKKIGVKLFKVGSAWEYFISYTICLIALYYGCTTHFADLLYSAKSALCELNIFY